MRFFTRELWLGAQNVGRSKENHDRWQEVFHEYRTQLEALRPRLTEQAYAFFTDESLHDGELLELRVIDGSRPAPLNAEVRRPWHSSNDNPVRVEMTVLDAYDVWRLSYAHLRRVMVDFPSDQRLFRGAGEGFGDWGYDELTDGGDGFLRHEVLFASGSTLLFEFKGVGISRTSRESVTAGQSDSLRA